MKATVKSCEGKTPAVNPALLSDFETKLHEIVEQERALALQKKQLLDVYYEAQIGQMRGSVAKLVEATNLRTLPRLSWVTFQVMRRTHSGLLRELDVAPEVRAQQMGHTVDVHENVYTRTSLESRRQAVNLLEAAIG